MLNCRANEAGIVIEYFLSLVFGVSLTRVRVEGSNRAPVFSANDLAPGFHGDINILRDRVRLLARCSAIDLSKSVILRDRIPFFYF